MIDKKLHYVINRSLDDEKLGWNEYSIAMASKLVEASVYDLEINYEGRFYQDIVEPAYGPGHMRGFRNRWLPMLCLYFSGDNGDFLEVNVDPFEHFEILMGNRSNPALLQKTQIEPDGRKSSISSTISGTQPSINRSVSSAGPQWLSPFEFGAAINHNSSPESWKGHITIPEALLPPGQIYFNAYECHFVNNKRVVSALYPRPNGGIYPTVAEGIEEPDNTPIAKEFPFLDDFRPIEGFVQAESYLWKKFQAQKVTLGGN